MEYENTVNLSELAAARGTLAMSLLCDNDSSRSFQKLLVSDSSDCDSDFGVITFMITTHLGFWSLLISEFF